jgi:3-hydroxyacyl-CoA dehydrogenase/enoyl-CoA hydratase/3-hydroxybutyryl-CoA epimerase
MPRRWPACRSGRCRCPTRSRSIFTGGTLSYIDFMGTKNFVELCRRLGAKYGARFTPPTLLVEMAEKGETFYGRFRPKKPAAA